MRCLLTPSILSSDFGAFKETVGAMGAGGADWIHFDVMDGQFVPPITFGAQLVKDLRTVTDTAFEAHLMTQTPDRHFDAFIEAGCKRITFHAEATFHSHRLIQSLHDRGVEAGVAINPATPFEAIVPVLHMIDLALVMTVNPGWGGQQFIRECLHKVRRIRQARPDLDIQVDGGIDPTTIGEAHEAGATVFVAGSFISRHSSPAEAMRELREACAKPR